ncbi:MAG: CsbD family protein [Capsulimonadaceae bacterium]|nr:CsbD family protein [Capsulimonadaceae bacterium]
MPNKDVVKGLIKQGEGRVQEFVGNLIDDPNLMAKGEANEETGKAQETVGHLKEAVHSATRTGKP